MVLWRTNRLAYHPDYISPSGAAEIRLLIQQEHSQVPVFPTALLHARAAVDLALS